MYLCYLDFLEVEHIQLKMYQETLEGDVYVY